MRIDDLRSIGHVFEGSNMCKSKHQVQLDPLKTNKKGINILEAQLYCQSTVCLPVINKPRRSQDRTTPVVCAMPMYNRSAGECIKGTGPVEWLIQRRPLSLSWRGIIKKSEIEEEPNRPWKWTVASWPSFSCSLLQTAKRWLLLVSRRPIWNCWSMRYRIKPLGHHPFHPINHSCANGIYTDQVRLLRNDLKDLKFQVRDMANRLPAAGQDLSLINKVCHFTHKSFLYTILQ